LKGAFYFFLEHSLHEEEWKEFLAVVRILADEGVGGQRTSGRGQFKRIEVIDVPLSTTEHAPWQVGLSPFSPADEREFHEALHFYELFVRGGGTLGHRGEAELHRRQARFVREGFLLKKHAYGRLVDVSPDSDKSMLRYGMNFPIPLGAY
jgi:CRISPR-associated protein Csm4